MDTTTATATKTKWVMDATHSELLFKVRHLMISNVKGEFRVFNAEVNTSGDDFSNASINATIDVSSVFTNNDDRDKHLKAADFFDTDNYKEMHFAGTSFKKIDNDTFELKGNLTIKSITKEVTLDVEFGGINKDLWGNEKAGFSLTGKIHRKDWGLSWNAVLETGGVALSDEIKISAEIQFVKKAA